MNIIKSGELIRIFRLLNENELPYILLRNINMELPKHLKVGKDIDLLIKKKDEKEFIKFFTSNKYHTIKHPFKHDTFLYGVDHFKFIYNNKNKIIFDLCFQIAVRSLDAGQWIPLDKTVQESAWMNKRFKQLSNKFGYWTLSYEDEFICLVTRSIFDKKEFQDGYIQRINELIRKINTENVVEKLSVIFFKFTPFLMDYLTQKKFKDIINFYIAFKEY